MTCTACLAVLRKGERVPPLAQLLEATYGPEPELLLMGDLFGDV